MDETLEVVTEIGVFGDLNIEDPTTKKILKERKELDIDSVAKEIKETINRKQ